MGSSGIEDSGRVSGGGPSSNFKQTCSLLSRYLKEKCSFEELNLGLSTHNSESRGTMNLLPMIEKSGSGNPPVMFPHQAAGRDGTLEKSDTSCPMEDAQMTIFYAGQVTVFNDLPADKAAEIMTFAGKSSAAQNRRITAGAPLHASRSPAESTTSTPRIAPTFAIQDLAHNSAKPAALRSDLPIARKNSLARFLEKRKDRITASAPYQTSKPAQGLARPPKTDAWLGLTTQFSYHSER